MVTSTPVDIVQIYAASTGTGAITLGANVPGYRGVEALVNGNQYTYSIRQDANYELGVGTYLSSGTQLTRSPLFSSNGGSPINLPSNAEVSFVLSVEDLTALIAQVSLNNQIGLAAASALATQASLSAAAALVASNIKPDIPTGISTTAEGGYFLVANAGNVFATLYQKKSGAAIDTGLDIPSYQAVFSAIGTGTVVTPTTFTDSATPAYKGGYYMASPLARTIYQTSATSITIQGYTDIYTAFPQFAQLAVISNGAAVGTVTAGANGLFSGVISNLPAGTKTLQIVNGLQSKPNTSIVGTYLISVTANAPILQIRPAPTNRVVILSDSIGVGADSTTPGTDAYIPRIRAVTTDSLVAVGYGYNTFNETAGTPALRSALVTQIAALGASRVAITLGTNDYGLSATSASTFGTNYAAFLDAVHAALPSVTIFAVTPIVRANETANSFGNTLGDYRAAIGVAASGRAWVVLVDSTTFVTTSDLDDGIHPTSLGHLKFAQAFAPSLGYAVPNPPIGNNPLNANDANGSVSNPTTGVYRGTKNSGGSNWNCGFYSPLRTGDFRYQFDIAAYQDTMIGINAQPQLSSGYADMIHQLYIRGDGNMQEYAGNTVIGSVGSGYNPGNTPPYPNTRFWLDRTGSTVTFHQGNSSTNTYANSITLITVGNVTGSIALDLSMFTVGSYIDVTPVS